MRLKLPTLVLVVLSLAASPEARTIGVNPVFMGAADLEAFVEKEYEYYAEKSKEWGIRVN